MAMTKDELRQSLRRHHFTLQEFADEFGVSYETLCRWGASTGVPRWAVRLLGLMDQHGRAFVIGQSAQARAKTPVPAPVSSGQRPSHCQAASTS